MIARADDGERRMLLRSTRSLAVLLLLAGCGSSSGPPGDPGDRRGQDAGVDHSVPSDAVTGSDGSLDATIDGRPDSADTDAASDGQDVHDAGPSADGSPADASPETLDAASPAEAGGDVAIPGDAGEAADHPSGDASSGDGGSPDADADGDGPSCPPEVRRAGWSILAAAITAVGNPPGVDRPSLVVTTTDRPTVAWDESGNLQAMEWIPKDCAFEMMGIPRFGSDPSLVAVANDRVLMASVQSMIGPVIALETFDGANWVPVYALLRPTVTLANMSSTRIALDSIGSPVVAWIENQFSAPKLQVARWNGAWTRLTDATGVLGATVRLDQTRNGFSSLPFDLALGGDDQPIVSWRTTTAGPTVARFNGTQWAQLGTTLPDTPSFSSADPNAPVLRVDSTGALYAVWSRLNGSVSANVARWSGTAWTQLGGALTTAIGSTLEYGMALDGSGAPIVATNQVLSSSTSAGEQIFTYRWNGSSWLSPALPLDDHDPPSFVTWPSIVVDHAGRWLVTWVGAPTSGAVRSVYLARFTPPTN